MTRYARFDHTQPVPQQVTGWYDTGIITYSNLPSEADLLVLTDEEWEDHMDDPNAWAVNSGILVPYVAPPPPPPTLQQQAMALLLGPVPVQSTGTPALNSTYAIDLATQAQITAIASAINAGLGLPSGESTFNWPDAAGNAHQWSEAQFIQFAQNLMKYLYACTQVAGGHSTSLPTNTITIA